MSEYFLISLSFAIGLYCIKLLRTYDVHEKEPISKMALVTFLGGIGSFSISIILYSYLHSVGIRDLNNSFGALFIIGPVEETAKLIAFTISLIIIRKDINEPTDGMIYMSCVALGFSLIENYFYVSHSTTPVETMVLRLVISTPMHISFSIFMGLAFFSLLKSGKGWTLLVASLIYAILVHGIFDLIIFNEFVVFVSLMIIVKIAHFWALALLGYSTAVSPFRSTLKEFIHNYENPPYKKGIECLQCGDTDNKLTFSLGKIVVQKCSSCSYYVTTRDSLFYIFHHFGSTFYNLSQYYVPTEKSHKNMSTLFESNYVSDQKKIAYFDLEAFNEALNKFTLAAVRRIPIFIRTIIPPPEALLSSADAHIECEHNPFSKEAFFRFLLYPLDSPRSPKLVHLPTETGTRWCWGAFIIPEFWFLWHEIWGACFLVVVAEGLIARILFPGYDFYSFLIAGLAVRIIAAQWGHRVYYMRHGHWLNSCPDEDVPEEQPRDL